MSAERRPAPQPDLFDGEPVGRGPVGRCEVAVRHSLEHAFSAGLLDDRDRGLAGLALDCAAAVDLGRRRSDPYAVAAAARELREVLGRLRLDPSTRPEQGDAFDELVKALEAT